MRAQSARREGQGSRLARLREFSSSQSLGSFGDLLQSTRQALLLADPLAGLGALPVLYRFRGDRLQLSSHRPLSLGAPVGDGSARTSWEIAQHDLPTIGEDRALPPSLFVTTTRAADSREFIDLLAARSTALVGDPGLLPAMVRRVLIESRHAAASQAPRIYLVGSTNWASRVHLLEARDRLASTEDLLASISESASTWDLETRPTLCVLDPSIGPGEVESLSRTLGRHRGIALCSANVCNSTTALITVAANGSTPTYLQMAAPPSITAQPPTRRSPSIVVRAPDTTRPDEPVTVNVLGPVTVTGVTEDLTRRPLLTELIAYLSMHDDGALTRVWSMALWPDRRVPAQTIANRLSEARRVLGQATDGRPRLRRSGDRHHIVDITTDWHEFVRLADTRHDANSWSSALSLVRGRPFDDLQQGQWTVLDGFTGEIEHRIVECALRLGEQALGLGDVGQASFAALQALKACPFDERLYRLLMRSADAAGNRVGVEETLQMLALVLEIDGDPLRGVHPITASLYRNLVGN